MSLEPAAPIDNPAAVRLGEMRRHDHDIPVGAIAEQLQARLQSAVLIVIKSRTQLRERNLERVMHDVAGEDALASP